MEMLLRRKRSSIFQECHCLKISFKMSSVELLDSPESDTENSAGFENAMIFLASNLKNCKDLLEKSQLPEAKKRKEDALSKLISLYQEKFSLPITKTQLMKKINNMKSRLKKKTVLKKAGNQKIKLNEWEKLLFEILQGEQNPIYKHIHGALQLGFPPHLENVSETNHSMNKRHSAVEIPQKQNESDSFAGEPSNYLCLACDVDSSSQTKFTENPIKKPRCETDKYETSETRNLSTTELQRVVLLEQLSAARAQKEAAEAQISFYKHLDV